MDWPSLSVIIPSFNQGAYIERTLLSVLRQGYPGPLQVVVADGGSADGTVDVLRRYPQVQWWSRPDRGFVDAVTQGLAAATGEVVAIQSSDDYYLEGAFVRAVAALTEDPRLAFVTGNDVFITGNGTGGTGGGEVSFPPRKPYVTLLGPGSLIGRNMFLYVPQHCTFARRAAVERVGGLREAVDYCADFDLWYRLLHFGPALMLPDYLAVYQRHPAQRTQSKADRFIQDHKSVVEDAEADPVYAERFRPTPQMKRDIFLQWEVVWNALAGGEAGLEKARGLAREALRRPDLWPDYVLDYVRVYGSVRPTARQLRDYYILRLKQHAGLRAMFGKRRLTDSDLDKVTQDIDWWRDPAKASALPVPVSAKQ